MAVLLWWGGSALIARASQAVLPPAPQSAPSSGTAPQSGTAGRPQQSTQKDDDAHVAALPEAAELRQFGIHITAPTSEDEIAGRVRVRAEVAADRPAAVQAVDFFIDGKLMFSDANAPYELLWNSGRPAQHVIEVRAYGPGRQVVSDSLATGLAAPSAAGGYVARVERVELHVRVEGEEPPAGPLDTGMFRVLEDGVAQPVLAVERVADLPLAIGILVDHSGSMMERLDTALDAAASFVDGLLTGPQDKAFVLGFADVPIVFQEFTNDTERLAQAIELIDNGRNTALYDAIDAAAEHFEGSGGRRAVILLTDGADEGSEHRFREALEAAQRADVALYPVAVELSPRFAREHWILSVLAQETGGRLFSIGRRSDPRKIYEAIADDLRAQYRVSYAPLIAGGEGEWREIEVRLAAGAEDTRVRTRPGYFAR
jgi:VWFA-related protein